MLRLPIALLFVGVASAAFADMRGQVVCGIPPDEAVAYVYESTPGLWHYIGTLGRNINDRGNPSAQTALAQHAPEGAEYVRDVEIRTADFATAVVPLYRLHHPFIEMGAVNEHGEPLAWDYDPRGNIVGVVSEAGAGATADLGPLGLCGIPLVEATVVFWHPTSLQWGNGRTSSGDWVSYSPDYHPRGDNRPQWDDYALKFFQYDEDSGEGRLTSDPYCEFEVTVERSGALFGGSDLAYVGRVSIFRLGRPLAEGEANAQCAAFAFTISDAHQLDGVSGNAWLEPEMVRVCGFQ